MMIAGLCFTIHQAAQQMSATENTIYARKITLSPGCIDYVTTEGETGHITVGPHARCVWYDNLGHGEPLQIRSFTSSNGWTYYRIYTPLGYRFK